MLVTVVLKNLKHCQVRFVHKVGAAWKKSFQSKSAKVQVDLPFTGSLFRYFVRQQSASARLLRGWRGRSMSDPFFHPLLLTDDDDDGWHPKQTQLNHPPFLCRLIVPFKANQSTVLCGWWSGSLQFAGVCFRWFEAFELKLEDGAFEMSVHRLLDDYSFFIVLTCAGSMLWRQMNLKNNC